MCGGRGTRLACGPDDGERTEKPLVEVRGVPMVERVLAALRNSRVRTVHSITSPHAPDTRARLASGLDAGLAANVEIVDAPGEGYVSDLQYALDRVPSPTLTVACDLPLLAPVVVNRVLDRAEECPKSLAVYVPAALKRLLGTSTDSVWKHGGRTLAPTGLNVVARERGGTTKTDRDETPSMDAVTTEVDGQQTNTDTDVVHVSYDARLAVNVNRPADLAVAEALCE